MVRAAGFALAAGFFFAAAAFFGAAAAEVLLVVGFLVGALQRVAPGSDGVGVAREALVLHDAQPERLGPLDGRTCLADQRLEPLLGLVELTAQVQALGLVHRELEGKCVLGVPTVVVE